MRRLIPFAAATVVLLLASMAFGQATKVYYTETQFGPPLIYKMNKDGTGRQSLGIIPTVDILPLGIAFSPAGDKLYYSQRNGGFGGVQRVNSTGSGRVDIIPGLVDPNDMEIDWVERKLYFVDKGSKIIYRADVDGTNIELILSGGDQLGRPSLDLVNRKIYFGNFTKKEIERADLDGMNRETVMGQPEVNRVEAIAVSPASNKMYFLDSASPNNDVCRANMDGTGFEILVDGNATTSGLWDIEVDTDGGHIYWLDQLGTNEKGIWIADLDGSNARRLHATIGNRSATSLCVTIDPNSTIPCMTGNVDGGGSGPTDILFVNGSAGGAAEREVLISPGQEVLATIVKPPAGGNGRFVIHGNLGRPWPESVVPLPRNIGDSCFPIILSEGANPVIVANAARHPELVGASNFFGSPLPDPARAPSTLFQVTNDPNLTVGVVVTLQGAMFDPGASAPRGVSITNGVTFVML